MVPGAAVSPKAIYAPTGLHPPRCNRQGVGGVVSGDGRLVTDGEGPGMTGDLDVLAEQGVAVVGTGGATMVPYHWETMSVLQEITRNHRNGVHTHTTYAYTFAGPGVEESQVKGGVIGAFQDPQIWGPEIQQQVTAAQLLPALAAVQAGRTLEFGPFALTAERLSAGEKSVAWSEVQEITTKNGFLSVKQQGRWLKMSVRTVSRIPNFFLFRMLAEHLVEAARAPRQHPQHFGGPAH
jgi:hypothetical protein